MIGLSLSATDGVGEWFFLAVVPAYQIGLNREVAFRMESLRRKVLFSGHVQGVGFRYTVEALAAGLPVTGTVRNLGDGRVEMIAEGSKAELDRLLAAIQESMGSNITDKEIVESQATGEFTSFCISF